jgi:hypothetical protein
MLLRLKDSFLLRKPPEYFGSQSVGFPLQKNCLVVKSQASRVCGTLFINLSVLFMLELNPE